VIRHGGRARQAASSWGPQGSPRLSSDTSCQDGLSACPRAPAGSSRGMFPTPSIRAQAPISWSRRTTECAATPSLRCSSPLPRGESQSFRRRVGRLRPPPARARPGRDLLLQCAAGSRVAKPQAQLALPEPARFHPEAPPAVGLYVKAHDASIPTLRSAARRRTSSSSGPRRRCQTAWLRRSRTPAAGDSRPTAPRSAPFAPEIGRTVLGRCRARPCPRARLRPGCQALPSRRRTGPSQRSRSAPFRPRPTCRVLDRLCPRVVVRRSGE